MQSIILACGRGSRLDPYTRILPKPLFPIGEKPIAAILVHQLQKAGFDEIIIVFRLSSRFYQALLPKWQSFGIIDSLFC